MTVPYIFASATAPLPLSQLDSNFATAITLGSTLLTLGSTVTSVAGLTLTSATISSLSSALSVANGGTGLVSLSSGYIPYGNGTSAFSSSANMTFDGSTLTTLNSAYTGTLTGGTGVVNLGSGQFYKDASGNVGIGTSSPSSFGTLVVRPSSGTGTVAIQNSTPTNSLLISNSGAVASITYNDAFPLTFGTNSTERMRIDSSGNVGIGTSSPAYKLDVVSSGTFVSRFQNGSNQPVFVASVSGLSGIVSESGSQNGWLMTSASNYVTAYTNGTERMRLDTSGNLGLGVTPSAWGSSYRALNIQQFGSRTAALYGGSGVTGIGLTMGVYNDNTNFIYSVTGAPVGGYLINGAGNHLWFTGSSGTAGTTCTFTQAMTLDSSGNLAVGTTSAVNSRLYVANSGVANLIIGYNNTSVNYYDADTQIFRNSGATERMRINSSGNVGINTNSPVSLLSVYSNSGTASGQYNSPATLTLWNGNSAGSIGGTISFGGAAPNTTSTAFFASIYGSVAASDSTGTNGSLIFATKTNQTDTSVSERMRIDSSGNLLVGTTSNPAPSRVTVDGGSSIVPMSTRVTPTTGFTHYYFYNGNGVVGSISTNGSSTSFNTSSDYRLKENIVDAPLGNIDNIKVRSFDWIADGSHQTYGFIAQELVEVAPYAVHQPQDAEEMMAVDYSKLVPMMIKEIQDLKAEVNQLKAKVGI